MKKLLEELFRSYYRDVYGYLYSLCHDASLAEDLTSEVFLEVVRSIGRFRGESDVKTWLFSIARHRWYHYLRGKKGKVDVAPLEEVPEEAGRSPEEIVYDRQRSDRIRKLIEELPEQSRKVMLLRMDGYSCYEIGKRLGISESSVRVIHFRAKERIREIMKKEGFDYE